MKKLIIPTIIVLLISSCCKIEKDELTWEIQNQTNELIIIHFKEAIDSLLTNPIDSIVLQPKMAYGFSCNIEPTNTPDYMFPFKKENIAYVITNNYILTKTIDIKENWKCEREGHAELCNSFYYCTFTISESELIKQDSL